ncbi:DOMON-like domain-containing protein [Accumulibacter sp.]|uniref:DOMON-like domain-containing protein n=1 Tax=Accumulibacter sp. TaxID=2053492 RepID=UPI0025FCACBE|nr:DOMON-like domain-containing protein [Accumulibacter sp.]MCM8613940.1 DOMON-like domain-containing protein [Accumulibacter sp.]MCM8637673.1 DOMON-like domain-containing protein [Accumulibacter sp.]MCM8641113.1 DOMON-like domain-containing protein [Accumulibacter sp.]
MPITEFPLTLLCHPATPAPVVRSVEAWAARTASGDLVLAYRLRGDMVRLRIPPPTAPGRADGLWEHSCFEAFIGIAGEPAYHEFNFSPSGEWASYAFAGYRQPVAVAESSPAPRLSARLSAGRLEVEALIAAAALPAHAAAATLQVGLAAVVEAADVVDGSHSYWALHHPAKLPDFHHRDGFRLELAPAS